VSGAPDVPIGPIVVTAVISFLILSHLSAGLARIRLRTRSSAPWNDALPSRGPPIRAPVVFRTREPGCIFCCMNDRIVEERRGELVLSTDRRRLDVDGVLAMLHDSHWGGAVTRSILERAIANSVSVGVYRGDEQIAFARAVTDLSTFAYLTDVIVAGGARGRGIGSWMVEAILAHPDLQGLRRVALLTQDAQKLYEKLGFSSDMPTSTYMERRLPG
jgi:N-acetylglutamate synthase-like GNAT family acetyltransferase